MGDFDLTKINNERINIIVARVRPGKSEIIKNIFHHMGMNLPYGKRYLTRR